MKDKYGLPLRHEAAADAAAQQRADQAVMAQRGADAPLKPAKPQRPCDAGLFSDDAKQIDLTDLL